ncbi:MAG: glycosyltransferase family 4 protein [Deltaproteobacteria bacterium]|nr:glycosyltransferase family 4 protein [Deltaproteobacteria bacterium]
MRILYVCRVFSGFETSLETGRWLPTGAPTIYRVMEALDHGQNDVRFVMSCKGVGSDYRTSWTAPDDRDVTFEGLRHTVHVLASEHRHPAWMGRLRGPLTTLRHIWRLWRSVWFERPHLVYVDRSNVVFGALVAWLTRIPVVLRVMGVYPSMWETLRSASPAGRVTRWAYRAPFALVICTQDGSGGEYWLPKALRTGAPFHMLLNGFDGAARASGIDARLDAIPRDRTVVLFVGRFESIKGCEEFAEAMLKIHADGRRDIHAVMIGTGRLHDQVRARVAGADAEHMFTFIDRLPHDQIPEAHRRADVYVSLNRLGQLSNANLEAMSMGACMIVPPPQPERGIDIATQELINDTAAVRLPAEDQTNALAAAICALADAPARREQLRANMRAVAARVVKTWDTRVAEEFALIGEQTGCRL